MVRFSDLRIDLQIRIFNFLSDFSCPNPCVISGKYCEAWSPNPQDSCWPSTLLARAGCTSCSRISNGLPFWLPFLLPFLMIELYGLRCGQYYAVRLPDLLGFAVQFVNIFVRNSLHMRSVLIISLLRLSWSPMACNCSSRMT